MIKAIISLAFITLSASQIYAQSVDKESQLAKSDSLFAVGVDLYNAEKYEEAIPIFAQSDQIDKAVLDSTSNRRDYSAMWLASCYYQLGDTIKASETHKYYNYPPVDRRLTVKSDSLSAAGLIAYNNGDLENALAYFEQCAEIEKSVVGEEHVWYLNTLSVIDILYFYLASNNSDLGNYSEAIRLGTEAMNICEKVCGKENAGYATLLNNLADYNSSLGNYEETVRLGTEALNILEKVYGKEHPDYATSLNNLATDISHLGNYSEAIRLGTEALNIREKVYGKEHPKYANSLSNLASYNSSLGNYAEAVKLGTEVMNIYEKVYGKEHPDYATSLNNLALYNSYLGNYQEAIRLGTDALNIREKVYGKEHPKYATSLNNLASYNSDLGNYQEAISLCTETLNILEKVYGTDHPKYATSLNNLANYNYYLGNYTEAIRICTETLNILEKVYGTDHPKYATSLNNLAECNSSLDNYTEAIRLGTEALNIRGKVYGKEHPDYATSLNNLAAYNSYLGNYQEAIRLGTEALNIREKVYGREHPDYATSLSNLAECNSHLGNYQEAIMLGAESLKIRENALGKEHPDYAVSLNNLALYNSYLGNYTEAIRLGTEALNIRERVYGKEHPDYAQSLNNLALYNSYFGNYSEAIRLGTEAMIIWEKVYGREHPDYASSLNNLADYNSSLGNYADAVRLGTEAMNIYEKVYGNEHPNYASSLNNLATYNSGLGNYPEAIRLCTEALNICEKVYGREHPNYASSLGNLAGYYFYSRDIGPINHYSLQYTKLASALVKKTFAGLTSGQRQQFWEKYKAWYEEYVHLLSYVLPSDTLTMNGYNGVLLSKGLLLNSYIEFSKLIQENGDSEALTMYEDLKRTRTQVNKLREEYSSTDSIKLHYLRAIVDSLSRESDKMEKDLVSRSKVYGDYTSNLVITWDQVQGQLTDNDIAVEFVSFPLNADSTMYIAYALKKDWECPKMIPLFEEKQLLAVQKGDRYTTDSISRLVWKPLDEVMQSVKNVYFAPSGELYNIAIESIPTHVDSGNTLVGEHCDFYRLSSTRELALIKDESRWDEAAVYGGLQYGMSVEGMIEEDGKYEKAAGQKRGDSTPSYYVVREDSIGRGDRDLAQGLAYLEGTKKEAEAITHDLEQKAVDARLFTDSIGTETSFKALDGKKTSIIHIGTHGFFNDRKKEYKEDKLQLLDIDQQAKVIEDDALTRSGLYLAGADNVILNGLSAVPDSIDDGRLTAAEIAQLDLRGLDMVVLSACQTGLGEITGDGVFGLQRGFKKAGAQTIVMSLWKVDDEATTEFMTTFFENMKIDRDGHPLNKHEAFKEAQSKLKRDKDKYSDPYCWAAFVMLDGID